ncbi:MAG: ATP-binding protein [Paenibacillaceae bacterium]
MEKCWAEKYCRRFNEHRSNCHEYCIGYVQLQNIYSMSNIPVRYQHDLPMFADVRDKDTFMFLRDFKDNILNHAQEGHGLFIHSKIKGNGKTAWACKIMNEYFKKVVLDNNLRCRGLFINVPEFLDQLRSAMDLDKTPEELLETQDHIKSADIVIWDDIGTETPSKWVRQTLYKFINHREANDKMQIFTSNISLGTLTKDDYLGDRIVDRIKGQCKVLELVGKSHRDANWYSSETVSIS